MLKISINKKIALGLILGFVLFSGIAFAQQNPNIPKRRTQEENCKVFYKWFNIPLTDTTKKLNAVEDLPYFCTAQGLILWVTERLLWLAGSIAVIFLIVGGFRYLTSAGNEEAAEKGKKTLVTSIIGLVIIILSATIVRIVANTLSTGASARSGTNQNQIPSNQNQQDQNNQNQQNQAPPPEPADDYSTPLPTQPSPRGGN